MKGYKIHVFPDNCFPIEIIPYILKTIVPGFPGKFRWVHSHFIFSARSAGLQGKCESGFRGIDEEFFGLPFNA